MKKYDQAIEIAKSCEQNRRYSVYGREKRFADSQLWLRMTINWDGEAEICCENYKQEYGSLRYV